MRFNTPASASAVNAARRAAPRLVLAGLAVLALAACTYSSSSPPPPQQGTTVVVPPGSTVLPPGTTVVCPNGSAPPC